MKYAKLLYGWIGLALITSLLVTPASAEEVYVWTDENGVKHFSSIPPSGGQDATVQDIASDGSGAASGISIVESVSPQSSFESGEVSSLDGEDGEEISVADQQRLQMAERRSERRAAQADLERACAEANYRLAQIEPSRRVFYTDEDGETVRMDDEERVGEVDTLRRFLSENC